MCIFVDNFNVLLEQHLAFLQNLLSIHIENCSTSIVIPILYIWSEFIDIILTIGYLNIG